MRVLIVEDDAVTRRALQAVIAGLGHEVAETCDGREAWEQVQAGDFDVVVSDWLMPEMDGLELCRRIRALEDRPYCYVMLVTVRSDSADLVEGIMAGADEFVRKPWHADELVARFHAAERVVRLERDLAAKVQELEKALDEVKTLRGMLPICVYCKSIRTDSAAWEEIEAYVCSHSDAEFTHSICPTCYDSRVQPMLDDLRRRAAG